MNDFAKRLRIIRKKRGLTQKQLAVEVGEQLVQCIFRFGIQSYEIGERNPAFDQLITLADYFDVSIDYLVGRTDKPEINK